jgi:hypothetical protein
MTTVPEFDVILSFAGAERAYARAIYDVASANGLQVFLDEEFQHEIWGKNLVEYLDKTYRERGLFVLALLSQAYREKAFTKVERRAAFDRMINESAEYLLPVKVDDSWVDGLPKAMMLPPFGGHLKLLKQGVHHAEIETTLPGGIPPANY